MFLPPCPILLSDHLLIERMHLAQIPSFFFGTPHSHLSCLISPRSPATADRAILSSLGLYILAGQLEIPGVKNAAVDAVYGYFAVDVAEARCPDLRDVQMLFSNTSDDSPMRRLLVAHIIFYLFGKKRGDAPLPVEWEHVLSSSGRIGWAIVKMLSDWNWVMGRNIPPMRIKTRLAFHEQVDPVDPDPQQAVKKEEGSDN